MLRKDVKAGGHYVANVSGVRTVVHLKDIRQVQLGNRAGERFDVVNLKTGRRTSFHSAAKFQRPATAQEVAGAKAAPVAKPARGPYPDPTPTANEDDRAVSMQATVHQDGLTNGTATLTETAPVSRPRLVTAASRPSVNAVLAARAEPAIVLPSEPVPEGLRGDQPAAFQTVTARILAGRRQTKLVGYAGTGKTYLLGHVARWAVQRGFDVTVAAPTHKAAGVVNEKLKQFGAGDVEVRTIHSLLGLRLEPDYTNDTGGRVLEDTGKKKVDKGLVICDEASMVGTELKKHIDRVTGVTWLFVGDLAQLPPVGEAVSELLDNPDAALETVLRQADGSEILTVATAVRGGDTALRFAPGKDVFEVGDAEELFQAAYARFDSDAYRADAAHARMLVFRNVRRTAINARLRGLLVNSPDPYTPGEWLVMYAAFGPEKSRLNLMSEQARKHDRGSYAAKRAWKQFFDYKAALGDNLTQLHVSEEVRVRDAREDRVEIGGERLAVWRLAVETRGGGEYELPVLRQDEVPRVEAMKDRLVAQAAEARAEQQTLDGSSYEWQDAEERRRLAWQSFFGLEETFAQVDYAYAMTVHKSQGSTFDHAFVDVPDLMSSGSMAQRILYTAVTRPAKSLTFYK